MTLRHCDVTTRAQRAAWQTMADQNKHKNQNIEEPHSKELGCMHFYLPSFQFVATVEFAQEFHETCHSVTFYVTNKEFKRCCDNTMLESIHTKDESKRGSAFAFIFGVN